MRLGYRRGKRDYGIYQPASRAVLLSPPLENQISVDVFIREGNRYLVTVSATGRQRIGIQVPVHGQNSRCADALIFSIGEFGGYPGNPRICRGTARREGLFAKVGYGKLNLETFRTGLCLKPLGPEMQWHHSFQAGLQVPLRAVDTHWIATGITFYGLFFKHIFVLWQLYQPFQAGHRSLGDQVVVVPSERVTRGFSVGSMRLCAMTGRLLPEAVSQPCSISMAFLESLPSMPISRTSV